MRRGINVCMRGTFHSTRRRFMLCIIVKPSCSGVSQLLVIAVWIGDHCSYIGTGGVVFPLQVQRYNVPSTPCNRQARSAGAQMPQTYPLQCGSSIESCLRSLAWVVPCFLRSEDLVDRCNASDRSLDAKPNPRESQQDDPHPSALVGHLIQFDWNHSSFFRQVIADIQ